MALAACASPHVGVDHADPGADLFARAERSFRSGAYRKALTHYNEYLSRYPDGAEAPAALFREGEIYRRWKDFRTSRKSFQDLIDKHAESPLVPQAMAGVLTSLYDEKRYGELIQHADAFLKRLKGGERSAGILVILGDAYMAMDSPVDAVYFYAKAHEQPSTAKNKNIALRLKSTVKKLSIPDILALSERVTDPVTRGYLIYTLGMKEIDEKRYDDGARTLSQFVAAFPGHESVGEAQRVLQELEGGASGAVVGRHVLGCLLPLTGSYEHYGKKALRAIELAIAEAAPGGDVGILVKDTCSDSNQAALAVQAMARENVTAIIGPIITSEAAASKAQDARIPIIVLTQRPDITKTGDYVFRNFLTPQMQVRSLVSHAIQMMGIRRFAILYPQEKYGTVFLEAFRNEVQAQGAELVAVQAYGVNQADFSASIKRLLNYSGIEALFIPDDPDKAGLIIPQLTYHGISDIQLLGTNLWNSEKLIRSAGRFAQGAIFPEIFYAESPQPEVQNFVRMFAAHFGEPPGFIEALVYDTSLMLIEAFRAVDTGGRSEVRDMLSRMQFLQGVTGSTEFDETGDAVKKLELLKIEGSGFVTVGLW